ncbi:glycosyltransferase family 39 protein [bacterium]|nr:glycosyltransferase family 39 protein [bacterium]
MDAQPLPAADTAARQAGLRAAGVIEAAIRLLPWGVAAVCAFQYVVGYADYNVDAAALMTIVLDFVQDGEIPLAGQTFFRGLRLAPLAPLLTAPVVAISRSPALLYAYVVAFKLASLPLFFAAARGVSRDDLFPHIATGVFGVFVATTIIPNRPMNTAFVPPFLALAVYFLVRAQNGRAADALGMWMAIGLCMQLHMTTGILVVTALFDASRRGTRNFLMHLAGGGAVILLLHATVLYTLVFGEASLAERVAGESGGARTMLAFAGEYVARVADWVVTIVINVGIVAAIYLIRGIRRPARLQAPDMARLCAFHIAAVLVVLPALSVIKQQNRLTYLFAAAPFLAILIALGARDDVRRLRQGPREWRRFPLPYAMITLFLLLAGLAFSSVPAAAGKAPCEFWRLYQIDSQVAIARGIQAATAGMSEHRIEALVYENPDGESRLDARSFALYESLLRYLADKPDYRDASPASTVGVFVRPRDMPWPPAVESELSATRTLGRVRAGCVDATIIARPGSIPGAP